MSMFREEGLTKDGPWGPAGRPPTDKPGVPPQTDAGTHDSSTHGLIRQPPAGMWVALKDTV